MVTSDPTRPEVRVRMAVRIAASAYVCRNKERQSVPNPINANTQMANTTM